MDIPHLLLFAGAALVLIFAPGPDLLFLLAQGMGGGPRAGLAAALGLAAGNTVHTAAAALGASVVFRSSPAAFTALKFAGAAYLLYLAWQALKHRRAGLVRGRAWAGGGWASFRRALLMNALNPKVALFFLALLPQFAVPDGPAVALQMLLLGAIFIVLVVVVYGPIGLAAGAVGDWLLARPGVNTAAAWLLAGLFGALALRLVLSTAPA